MTMLYFQVEVKGRTVGVLAPNQATANQHAQALLGDDPLVTEAAQAIANAEFRTSWDLDVRKVLVRAAQTEGDLPPFAVKQVKWALGQARKTEQRLARDLDQGNEVLSRLPIQERLKVGV